MKGVPLLFLRVAACAISMMVARGSLGTDGGTQEFVLPLASAEAVWEAELAASQGQWLTVKHAWASGGAYVETKDRQPAALEFPFVAKAPCTVQFWPLWWRHGERKVARRFPYPFQAAYGPDVLDCLDNLVFFTAPVMGRVGVLDMQSEKLIRAVDVGGYLTDLIVDRATRRVFVADAKQDRVVVLDADSHQVRGVIPVPGQPWHLALGGERLFVGCMKGKQLVVVDTQRSSVTHRVSLSFYPQQVEVVGKDKPQVVVLPIVLLYDPVTLKEEAPERFTHVFGRRRGVMFPIPKNPELKRVGATPHAIRTRVYDQKTRQWIQTDIDVSAISKSPKVVSTITPPLYDIPGPDILDKLDNILLFTSPITGKVGVFDMTSDSLVGAIDVGGYLADLVIDVLSGKAYVSDTLGNRVVVIDARARRSERRILGAIPVPDAPTTISLHRNRLFVCCHKARCVAVIDTERQEVSDRIPLPAAPSQTELVRLEPSYAPNPYPASEVDAPRRLGVRIPAVAFDVKTMNPVEPSAPAAEFRKRNQVAVASLNPVKQVAAENSGVVVVDSKRFIDVVSVIDPQQLPDPSPLASGDSPGTITVSMDGGPSYDWCRGIWITPEHEKYLVNETKEFWRWNAPRFQVAAGKHVLRVEAHSPYARLDAVKVVLSPVKDVSLVLSPEPAGVHAAVPLPVYQGVFYDKEPVRFSFVLSNRRGESLPVRVRFAVRDYMGALELSGDMETNLAGAETWRKEVEFPVKATGVFSVSAALECPSGAVEQEHHFLRLPKLENPRLLFRKEEMPEIRKRIARYPRLFARYAGWLRKQCETKGFLPETLTPTFMSNEYHNVTPRWRAVACQFASLFLDDSGYFAEKVAPLLQKRENLYETYHQSRFGGSLACLFDMAGVQSDETRKRIPELFADSLGVSEFLAENFVALDEPLSPKARAVLNQQMMWLVNVERYFCQHAGRRGGNWWLTTRTGCTCPLNSFGESFVFYRNVFGQEKMFEKPFIGGMFTHQQYVHPLFDKKAFFGGGGLFGSQIRWAVPLLARQPVEKHRYGFHKWLAEMDGPLEAPEEKQVARLMSKDFALVLPMFVAFGWCDPLAPEVAWEELPPSALFDAEGEAAMKSRWREDSTSVYFCSGLRDVAYHNQPTHFEIMKAGQMLIGTGSLVPEDGSPSPAWGNVVVVGDEWPLRWKANVGHPRIGEFAIMDRFSPPTQYYTIRNRAVCGFLPPYYLPEDKLYGGKGFYQYGLVLGLHGHSQHPFIKEGEVVAYETWPEFDYVAGDATNAWPAEQVAELYRQLVFLRDDVVVIYDRGVLGPKGSKVCWLAATGPDLGVDNNRFVVRNETACLQGEILVPKEVVLRSEDSMEPVRYGQLFYKGQKVHQRVLEVHPVADRRDTVEFLTIMTVGVGDVQGCRAKVMGEDGRGRMMVELQVGDRRVLLALNRRGPVGGHIAITGGPRRVDHALVERLEDGYDRWSDDPQYARWIRDSRFRFLSPVSSGKQNYELKKVVRE